MGQMGQPMGRQENPWAGPCTGLILPYNPGLVIDYLVAVTTPEPELQIFDGHGGLSSLDFGNGSKWVQLLDPYPTHDGLWVFSKWCTHPDGYPWVFHGYPYGYKKPILCINLRLGMDNSAD
jgi:hypothetical protein